MSHTSHRRLFSTAVKWLFSIGMLAYALHAIDGEQVMQMLTRQNPWIALTAIALAIVQMAISTFRWQRLLALLSARACKPGYATLFNLNYISIFFNNCLPGTIGGDVVRVMLLKSEHCPLTLAAHSVIIDRLMAVLGIFVMVILGLPWLGGLLPTLPVAPLFGVSVMTITIGLLFLNKAPGWLAKFPSTAIIRMATHLTENIRRTVFAPRDFAIMLVQAVTAHGCYCLIATLLAASIGVEFAFGNALLLIPLILLLVMLPISVGGWGVRELSMVGMLGLVGIEQEAAITISVQLGIVSIVASLPGAWCYVSSKKKSAPSGNAARQG